MWVKCAECGRNFVEDYVTDTRTQFICKKCQRKINALIEGEK